MLLEWTAEDKFVSYRGGKLDVYRLQEDHKTNKRELQQVHIDGNRNGGGWRDLPGVTCMAFNRALVKTSPHVLDHSFAAGTNIGSITLMDVMKYSAMGAKPQANTGDIEESEIIVCTQPKNGRRACTGLAWHPNNPSLLAATFEKFRSDYSAIVWDITNQTKSESSTSCLEVTKCSMEEAASTLAWSTYDSPSLIVGTAKGLLRLYDLRTFNKFSNESITIPASNKKIKGIRCNPFNSNIIATFIESTMEPVKIWDLRKISDGKSKVEPISTIQIVSSMNNTSDGSFDGASTRKRGDSTNTIPFGNITDVQWCVHRQNLISAASSTSKYLQIYNIDDERKSSSGPFFSISIPRHVNELATISNKSNSSSGTNNTIQAFCWQSENAESCKRKIPRVLVGTDEGFLDTEVIENVALGFSAGDYLASGFGVDTMTGRIMIEGTDVTGMIGIRDIEMTMRSRAIRGYGIDAVKNVQVLNLEITRLDDAKGSNKGFVSSGDQALAQRLCRLWSWMDRVESLVENTPLQLENCGVLAILTESLAKIKEGSEEVMIDGLRMIQYRSRGREIARALCGWAGRVVCGNGHLGVKEGDQISLFSSDNSFDSNSIDYNNDLSALINEYENLDGFERATALALFHGNVNMAVEILQRYTFDADNDPSMEEHVEEMKEVSNEYRHLCSLVAMCIAGYSGAGASDNEHSWALLCRQVIHKLQKATVTHPAACYLKVACKFLLCSVRTDSSPPHQDLAQATNGNAAAVESLDPEAGSAMEKFLPIIKSRNISLEDRIGFACTYLSDTEVVEYLSALVADCQATGDYEGVKGRQWGAQDLLQKCIDIAHDIQTTALLVCRTLIISEVKKSNSVPNSTSSSSASKIKEDDNHAMWLYEYRQLLNKWELFMERATLDVAIGRRYRWIISKTANEKKQPVTPSKASLADANKLRPSLASKVSTATIGGGGSASRTDANRTLYRLPLADPQSPHVFLRCNFCASSLPVDCMQKQSNAAWLRRQRPVISCCPNCKKPLPRCYVCLLYMGMINPQVEYNRAIQRKRIEEDMAKDNEEFEEDGCIDGNSNAIVNEHNVLDYGRWFMFCQLCKHGGHAGCLEKWFSGGHRICGVNGCNCLCHDLSREATKSCAVINEK